MIFFKLKKAMDETNFDFKDVKNLFFLNLEDGILKLKWFNNKVTKR